MTLSSSFCFNIFSLLRDFLQYKFYYIDPLFINMENLINCKEGHRDFSHFNYNFEFQKLEKCLGNPIFDDSCYDLCS